MRYFAIAICLALAVLAGCANPAIEQAERLQLAGLEQYRAEMQTYHTKSLATIRALNLEKLDAAFTDSVRLAAVPPPDPAAEGAEPMVPLSAVFEKVAKVAALRADLEIKLTTLDTQFAERDALAARLIRIGQGKLDLITAYTRLAAAWRALWTREPEFADLSADARKVLEDGQ